MIWRGHPKGVTVCFLTELWERFSYYGMRALLIYYLTQHLLYTDNEAYLIYGAYTALVYMTPVIGGALADRYLGARKAVTLGAILLVLGHFGMTFEGSGGASVQTVNGAIVERDPLYENIFFLSLALIVVGVGFLKTNASTIVGQLYDKGDPRRDAGFTYFYMGINLGGALAPILCGWLGQTYGWRYGFGLAGVGMLIGLATFLRGQKYLDGRAEPPSPKTLRESIAPGVTKETAIYLFAVLLVGVAWVAIGRPAMVGGALSVTGASVGLFILYFAFRKCDAQERDKLLVCATLIAFTVGFWALYEQMGSSLNLFADRVVDRTVFGHDIKASMFQSLPAIFVILLAPVFSILWLFLGRRGREPGTPIKFAMGLLFLACAFLVLPLGIALTEAGEKVSLIWFMLNFLFLVAGELCLAPAGLSMVTKLAPARIVGVMMGTFFLAYSASSFIAAKIAQLTSAAPPSVDAATDFKEMALAYAAVYGRLGLFAVGCAAFLFLLSPFLTRRMHDEGVRRVVASGRGGEQRKGAK